MRCGTGEVLRKVKAQRSLLKTIRSPTCHDSFLRGIVEGKAREDTLVTANSV